MIIITNPHFSQNRVPRDSLPTQLSNLDNVVSDSIVLECLAKISSNDEKQTQIFKQNFQNLFYLDKICIFGIGYWIYW